VTAPSRADAARLDAADPLSGFRERFLVAEGGPLYMNGNSLGPLPLATRHRLLEVVAEEWGVGLVESWEGWLDLPRRVGDLVGRAALGAAPGQVVVGDSTTVCLYRLAAAALDLAGDRRVVVLDRGEFPTDRYVVEGLAAARGLAVRWTDGDPVEGVGEEDLAAALAPGDVALVLLSLVSYRSGALADMAAVTAQAGRAGARVLWDVSHAVGAVPIALDATGAEVAVGCTYKHLNAGPGAPAFSYVRRDLQERMRSPIQGWFGQRDQFAMGPAYDPQPDVRRFLAGTPPVIAAVGVEVGAGLVAEAGIDAVRAKAVGLTELAVALHDAWLAPLGATLGSPRDPARRGAHLAVRHPRAEELCARLARDGVVTDFRGPDVVRLGPAVLATRFVDVWDAMERLRAAAAELA
jgi:kynureninase